MRIRKLKKGDKEYPKALENIFNPPPVLFIKGEILPSDDNAIAVVGTRRATFYGLESSEKLSYDLALAGITIVSGMAKGIDTAAHRGALKAGGRTIAVLGSGHNHIYPPENERLYNEIIKNGAVISEFPPDMPPFPTNFPKRNRIISGLAKGVVVVEAPRKSGALITAALALEEGREVFAMPGNINSAKSNGTNALIKEGAKLVEHASDILEELKFVLTVGEGTPTEPYTPWKCVKHTSKVCKAAGLSSELSSEEKTVFGALSDEPKPIDDISRASDIPIHRISEVLVKLELKRLVKALPGENFILLR